MDCPDDTTLQALFEGSLDRAARDALSSHLGECDVCRALVADLARASEASAPATSDEHARGETLGRYVILETVGAGAMGVVYGAYDSELGRKVALKFLRDETGKGSSHPERAAMLREAQALARLAHPNVITVHDVGTLDGEVFIAMEFVEGATLRAWLREAPRERARVIDVFRQAGEGLAAAHAAGLVHRDFKPDNVLVGADGRVRVTDFGLARSVAIAVDTSPGRLEGGAAERTATAIAGTPAYMAPEVVARGSCDARADQFSFCVAFCEALCGERPFAGDDLAAVHAAAARGELRPMPIQRVPRWLRRILVRGLAAEPDARWPSMAALLKELARAPRFGAARIAAAAASFAALAIASVTWAAKSHQVCRGADAAWGDAWDDARAAAIEASFRATGRPAAPFAASAVKRALDAERARWIAMHTGACEATRVRGEQPEAVLGLRMQCLEDRRREVAALAGVFEHADAAIVDRAIGAVAALPDLDDCGNTRALEAPLPRPADPALRTRIDRMSDNLAEASALEYAGQYGRGLALADAAGVAASDVGYAPTLARLALVRGRLLVGTGDMPGAEGALHEAAALAEEAHEDTVAADAWTELVNVVGFKRARPAEGELWSRYAEAAIRRAGGDDEREAKRLNALAVIYWRRETKLAEALALVERVRPLYGTKHGAHYDFEMAACDELEGGVLFDMGRFRDALPRFERVRATRERLFGPNHPSLWSALVNLGEVLVALDRPDEAIALYDRVAATGPLADGSAAYAKHRLAAALRLRGDAKRALDEDRASLALLERAGEKDSYWTSWPLTGVGLDLLALGDAKGAVAPLEKAVAERGEGTVVAEVAESTFALARALWESGVDRPRARALAESARDRLRADAARYQGDRARPLAEIESWLASR